MDPVAIFSGIPAFIMAAAAWRSSKKNSPNGAFTDIQKTLWFQGEQMNKIQWYLVDHLENKHGPDEDAVGTKYLSLRDYTHSRVHELSNHLQTVDGKIMRLERKVLHVDPQKEID
jgi:hypothetical protein